MFPLVFSQDEIIENQMIVDIYIAENGRALVTGFVNEEALDSMPFLKNSSYVFNNDSSQMYAVTDSLTSKLGSDWTFNFSIIGYYLGFISFIYLPSETVITGFEIPPDFAYTIGVENSSVVFALEGFQSMSPQVLLFYQQTIPKGTTDVHQEFPWWFIILLGSILTVLFLILKGKRAEISHPPNGIKVTLEMQKVMETLSERENSIVRVLFDHGGSATQARIRRETAIAKSSLSGILNTLKRKKIIKKREYGRTNLVELSDWFLKESGGK
jgi:DNA-binding HxlR family transcriptional regulator